MVVCRRLCTQVRRQLCPSATSSLSERCPRVPSSAMLRRWVQIEQSVSSLSGAMLAERICCRCMLPPNVLGRGKSSGLLIFMRILGDFCGISGIFATWMCYADDGCAWRVSRRRETAAHWRARLVTTPLWWRTTPRQASPASSSPPAPRRSAALAILHCLTVLFPHVLSSTRAAQYKGRLPDYHAGSLEKEKFRHLDRASAKEGQVWTWKLAGAEMGAGSLRR